MHHPRSPARLLRPTWQSEQTGAAHALRHARGLLARPSVFKKILSSYMVMVCTQRARPLIMPKKQKNSSGDSIRRMPWVDPDDAPELTDEMLDRAVFRHGDTIIRRGRAPLNSRQGVAPNPRKT